MTKISTSIRAFYSEIERTFHKLRNLIGKKLSPRKQQNKMEDTLPHVRAVGVGATTGVVGA